MRENLFRNIFLSHYMKNNSNLLLIDRVDFSTIILYKNVHIASIMYRKNRLWTILLDNTPQS